MTCQEFQDHLPNDPSLFTRAERAALVVHLLSCPICYEASRFIDSGPNPSLCNLDALAAEDLEDAEFANALDTVGIPGDINDPVDLLRTVALISDLLTN
jgi:hypothetical protein